MPVVGRQIANQKKSVQNGSILSSVVPVVELVEDWIKFVLYGRNRVGKTTLACKFPKPLLLISFEPGATGGSRSISKVPGVHFVRITSKAAAIQLAKELRTDKTFKTHVLDTCTSLQDMILKELMNLEEMPVQLNWGSVPQDFYRERSEQAKSVMQFYRDLPAHTVFVAQEKDHNPPKDENNRVVDKLARERSMTDESFFASDLGAGTVKWMHDSCDYIARLYIEKEIKVKTTEVRGPGGVVTKHESEYETGKQVRRLRTILHTNYAAGFRSPTPEAVPEWIEAVTPDEFYEAITMVIAGKKTAKGKY